MGSGICGDECWNSMETGLLSNVEPVKVLDMYKNIISSV